MKKYNNIFEYPTGRKMGYIYAHVKLIDELKKILKKSGYENDFKHKFRSRLKFLMENEENCFLKSDWFEHLKGTDGLHAIRVIGVRNIRVLFIQMKLDGRQRAVLLTAFEEKNKKDYVKAIAIAENRIEEIKEETNE